MAGRIIRAAASLALVALVTITGCRSGNTNGKGGTDMPQRDVTTVMNAHVDALMATPGVAGVAIGETDDHTPCIIIYVVQLTDTLRSTLPATLEGHPVRIEESGEFRPLKSESPDHP
jgi:hypothetical protein